MVRAMGQALWGVSGGWSSSAGAAKAASSMRQEGKKWRPAATVKG